MVVGLLRAVAVPRARQRDERRIEQMKLRKAEEAELTSANVEVVGFAEKAVDASTRWHSLNFSPQGLKQHPGQL